MSIDRQPAMQMRQRFVEQIATPISSISSIVSQAEFPSSLLIGEVGSGTEAAGRVLNPHKDVSSEVKGKSPIEQARW